MKKQIYLMIALLLSVVMLAACTGGDTPTTPAPNEQPQGSQGLAYTPSEDGSAWIVVGLGSCADTEIVIPDAHEGKPVTGIADGAFAGTAIVKIEMPVSVTVIGEGAFANCNVLVTVVLPDNLTVIGGEVFMGCVALEAITLPKNVTTVSENAFDGCDALEKVVVTSKDIPAGLEEAVGESTTIDVSHDEHTWESVAAKEKTCTEDGWEAYEKCTVCGYADVTYLKATGHAVIVDVAGVAPTCTQSGYSEASHCDTCGETLSERAILPPHTFENNVCTGCSVKLVTWGGTADTSWYNSTDTAFVITTAEQLAGLAELVNGGTTFAGKTISLGVCIDLANRDWTPIGFATTTPFAGIFDGCGYTVSNLTVNMENNGATDYGFFGYCNGTIKNVGLFSVTMNVEKTDSGARVGALVGFQNGGAVTNCYVLEGSVTLSVTGRKETYNYVGGLIGCLNGGAATVDKCYSTASVSVSESGSKTTSLVYAGGLVGQISSGRVENCYAVGAVAALTSNGSAIAGGFVGNSNEATITNCYAAGAVNATTQSTNQQTYAYAGGLIGNRKGSTLTCGYAVGNVSASGDVLGGVIRAGGVTGNGSASIGLCPTDQVLSATGGYTQQTVGSSWNYTLAQMLTVTFHTETLMWSTDIWNITDGSLPTLK